MSTSNENKDKETIKGKEFIDLKINQEPCELNKVYENYKIISIRKNGFEYDIPKIFFAGKEIQFYKLIIEKDGIESTLELGAKDSERLAYSTDMFYRNTPNDIDLPKEVSFAWIKRETKRGNTYVDLNILWNHYD